MISHTHCRQAWRSIWLAIVVMGLLIDPGFSAPQPKKEHDPPVSLSGLTKEEQARFEEGLQLFEFPFTLRQEMGLTSPMPGFDRETSSINLPIFLQKRIPEPNVTEETVRKLVDFVTLLAPPARDAEFVSEAHQVTRGEKLFRELACAKCHVPSYRTSTKPFTRIGDSTPVTFAVLLDREIAPYSDFLLHDLGPTLNDGVALGVAKPGEYKTPPLWGVRFRMHQLLHDARANNLEQAIIYHGGEAAASRNRFLSLSNEDRQALIEFLKTL